MKLNFLNFNFCGLFLAFLLMGCTANTKESTDNVSPEITETENQEAALGGGDPFYNETKESDNDVVYDLGPADYDYDDPKNSGDRYHEPPMYN